MVLGFNKYILISIGFLFENYCVLKVCLFIQLCVIVDLIVQNIIVYDYFCILVCYLFAFYFNDFYFKKKLYVEDVINLVGVYIYWNCLVDLFYYCSFFSYSFNFGYKLMVFR